MGGQYGYRLAAQAAPQFCNTLTVTLNNDALISQGAKSGTYQLSDFVNEKPSWILKSNKTAIWYVPKWKEWIIGNLKDRGTTIGQLTTYSDQGEPDLFEVPAHNWYYSDDTDGK